MWRLPPTSGSARAPQHSRVTPAGDAPQPTPRPVMPLVLQWASTASARIVDSSNRHEIAATQLFFQEYASPRVDSTQQYTHVFKTSS